MLDSIGNLPSAANIFEEICLRAGAVDDAADAAIVQTGLVEHPWLEHPRSEWQSRDCGSACNFDAHRRAPEALRNKTDSQQYLRYAGRVFDLLAEIAEPESPTVEAGPPRQFALDVR